MNIDKQVTSAESKTEATTAQHPGSPEASQMDGSPPSLETASRDDVDKPWRKAALGYQNIDFTDDNGIRQIDALEEMVWSAFKGRPPEGYRVSFLDGNPANCRLDNLVLLSPEEAKALDASNVVPLPRVRVSCVCAYHVPI